MTAQLLDHAKRIKPKPLYIPNTTVTAQNPCRSALAGLLTLFPCRKTVTEPLPWWQCGTSGRSERESKREHLFWQCYARGPQHSLCTVVHCISCAWSCVETALALRPPHYLKFLIKPVTGDAEIQHGGRWVLGVAHVYMRAASICMKCLPVFESYTVPINGCSYVHSWMYTVESRMYNPLYVPVKYAYTYNLLMYKEKPRASNLTDMPIQKCRIAVRPISASPRNQSRTWEK